MPKPRSFGGKHVKRTLASDFIRNKAFPFNQVLMPFLQRTYCEQSIFEYGILVDEVAAIQKWDGHLPNVTGGAVPFISADQKSGAKNNIGQ